jgi:hypothetical protein
MNNIDYECAVITGATADAMKTAFDLWNRGGESFSAGMDRKVIVCTTLFDATHLLVFYYVPPKGKGTIKGLSENAILAQ